jgi:prepilin-type N-terminal cleavage/methylation domain-containing protein
MLLGGVNPAHSNAFTLAEVLITLGIIGVVAAITIPTLIKNFQMKSYETAFKKEYSAIQNAINYLSVEENLTECYVYLEHDKTNGNTYYSSVSNDCSAIKQGLINKLRLTQIPLFVSKYARFEDVIANGGQAINKSLSDGHVFASHNKSYTFPDGAIVTFPNYNSAYYAVPIVLDVNGKKGPNKWGYDVFYLTLSQHSGSKNLRLGDEWASIIEKGGKFPRTILQNAENSTSTGWFWN